MQIPKSMKAFNHPIMNKVFEAMQEDTMSHIAPLDSVPTEQTKLPKLNMSDLGRNLTFYFPEVLKISVIFKNFVF